VQADEQSGVLREYGDQHNLLEMRGAGWEHVVASPNTERAWSMEMLAELAEASGTALPTAELRESAARIRDEVIKQLWDDEAGWFRSRYPDGTPNWPTPSRPSTPSEPELVHRRSLPR
jgi:hypothetical protein